MLNLSDYTTDNFPKVINSMLADKSAKLEVPSVYVLGLLEPKQIDRFFDMAHTGTSVAYKEKPKTLDLLVNTAPFMLPGSGWTKLIGALFIHLKKTHEHTRERAPLEDLIWKFTFTRPLVSLEFKERGMMRAMAELLARQAISSQDWHRFEILLTVKEFFCCEPEESIQNHPRIREAKVLLKDLLTKCGFIKHDAFLAETEALIDEKKKTLTITPGQPLGGGMTHAG